MSVYLPNIDNSTGLSTSNGTINTTASGVTKTNQATTGNTAGTTANNNVYTPGQEALQNTANQQAGQFLTTGIAPGVQQELNAESAAYMQNFDQNVAPGLAAQYGAGSPAIGSELATGLQQLTGNVYQNQAQNFNSALGTAGNLAYNAVGNTGQSTTASNAATNSTQDWQQIQNQANQNSSAANNFGISTAGP